MSRTYHHGERRIRVRGVRREPTDLRRLARALIDLAAAEMEAEAEAQHKQQRHRTKQTGYGSPKKQTRGKRKPGGAV